MKKIALIVIMALGLAAPVYGQYEIQGQQLFARGGVWIGPNTPFPGSPLSTKVDTSLGGGAFIRFYFPSDELMIELNASYQHYQAYDIASLEVFPFGAGLTYKLPIDFTIEFFLRAGAGGAYLSTIPSGKSNVLPMANLGLEFSFPTGPMVNVGLRIDYHFVYESFLQPPAGVVNYTLTDGHFLSFGLMVNFDIPAK